MHRATSDAGVVLTLFDGPVLYRRGDPVRLSPFQTLLLAIVAVHDHRPVSRVRVAQLLWNATLEAAVAHRLSQLVYEVNRRAIATVIEGVGDTLTLASGVDTDLARLWRKLRSGEVDDLDTTDLGSFLGHLPPYPTRDLEDWIEGKRLKIRGEMRRKAAAIWADCEGRAAWEEAARAAEFLLSVDPSDEQALRRLMEGLAMAGKTVEAEAAFRGFSERQQSDPSEDTHALLERIRRIEPGEPPADGGERFPEPPLLGRERELSVLAKVLRTIPPEELGLVVVSGEGGIGKTRLVAEALKSAPIRGIRVLKGQSAELERDIPLSPILEALDADLVGDALKKLRDPWKSVLLALMPQFHVGPGPLAELPYIRPDAIPRRLFEAFRLLLVQLVEDGPLVLFFDDFQSADKTSIAVLEYLRRRWDSGRLVVVVTVRPEGLSAGGRVARFLRDTAGIAELTELTLPELEEAPARELVMAVADRPITEDQGWDICRLGGLNPFFLIELTLEFLEGRMPSKPDLREPLPVPLSIRQVLAKRLEALAPVAEDVLQALAVIGHASSAADLSRVTEHTERDCVDALDQLQDFRLATWTGSEIVLRHELIRQTVYGRLSGPRKAWLHKQVATDLLEHRPAAVDTLALHFDRAGVGTQALRFAMEAAARAEAAGAVSEALRYLSIARRNSQEASQLAEIIERLGNLNYLHRNFREAAPLLELASERLRGQGRISDALVSEIRRVDALSQRESLPQGEFLRELRRIKDEARSRDDWEVIAKALDAEVHMLDRDADVEGVRRVLAEARECTEKGGERAECLARCILAFELFYENPMQALESARQAIDIAERLGLGDQLLQATNRLLVVMLHQGLMDTPEGRTAITRGEQYDSKTGDLFLRFNLRVNVGVWHLDIGEYDRALVAFRRAGQVIKGTEAQAAHLNLQCNLGELNLWQQEMTAAHAHYLRAQHHVGTGMASYLTGLVEAGLGLCALHRGDLAEARLLEERLPTGPARWAVDPSVIAHFRSQMLVRRGRPEQAAELLAEFAAEIEGHLVTNWIKLKLLEAQVRRRFDAGSSSRVATEAWSEAQRLGLARRKQELERLL